MVVVVFGASIGMLSKQATWRARAQRRRKTNRSNGKEQEINIVNYLEIHFFLFASTNCSNKAVWNSIQLKNFSFEFSSCKQRKKHEQKFKEQKIIQQKVEIVKACRRLTTDDKRQSRMTATTTTFGIDANTKMCINHIFFYLNLVSAWGIFSVIFSPTSSATSVSPIDTFSVCAYCLIAVASASCCCSISILWAKKCCWSICTTTTTTKGEWRGAHQR